MNLGAHLGTLEAWGLIQPVVAGARVEYRFRHALVHEAAYSTLLKQYRRELHQAVAEVLDAEAGAAPEDMAPVLAFHFNEAGDLERASRYFALAGSAAACKYAHREAIGYYGQAIQTAAQPAAALFLARGQVYELQGNFEAARLDFERSAETARAAGDLPAEWQALLSLGLLWAGRDYDRSGAYCQMAFELADKSRQPGLVARSYNRLGNWHLNVERPLEAAQCHDKALTIFQTLQDDAGIAETLDLLGMASMLGGDVSRGAQYYQQAIELNRRLDDQRALANVLGSQLMAANAGYQTMTLRPSPLAQADLTEQGRQAVRMVHDIGWRDGEAFADMILAHYAQGRGSYAMGLQAGQAGLEIATEIGHQQWMAGLHYVLGLLYYDFLAWPEAIRHLEAGLALSQAIRSLHWVRCHAGMLAAAYVEGKELDRAKAGLAVAADIRQPPQSIGERLVTYGQARLAQARGQLDKALQLAESLFAAAGILHGVEPASTAPLLLRLRGGIYADLGQPEHAEADFRLGIAAAALQGERPLAWRLHKALGELLQRQSRSAEAAQEIEQARALVAELATDLPEAGLRDTFRLRSGLFSKPVEELQRVE